MNMLWVDVHLSLIRAGLPEIDRFRQTKRHYVGGVEACLFTAMDTGKRGHTALGFPNCIVQVPHWIEDAETLKNCTSFKCQQHTWSVLLLGNPREYCSP